MLPNQQLKKATALALALGAILPATATGMPNRSDPSGASFTMPQTPVVRITTPTSGFDWGDAGIGAAIGGEPEHRIHPPPAASPSRCSASEER